MYSSPSAFRHPRSQSETGAFRYITGSPYSGTGLDPDSAFLFIPDSDLPDAEKSWHFGIYKICTKVERCTPCTSILLVVKRHPARPHCCWRKDTLNVHVLLVERHPARPHCGWWKNTLHAHTAGGGETSHHMACVSCRCRPRWGGAAMGMEELLVLGLRREVETLSSCRPSGAGSGRGCHAGQCRDRPRGAARGRRGGPRRVTRPTAHGAGPLASSLSAAVLCLGIG
jgi:hypothetical protein